jgi:hypothetical protein
MPQAAVLLAPLASADPHAGATAIEGLPEWFTLRGHSGVFRIDPVRSRDGVVVLANVNGREVGRCSVPELRENVYAAAGTTSQVIPRIDHESASTHF